MNRAIICVCAAVFCLTACSARAVTQADAGAFNKMAQKYELAVESGTPGTDDYRFIYSDRSGHVHIYAMDDGVLTLAWEATTLGSRATSLIVCDLYGDGHLKVLVTSVAGRVLIYDLASYELEWENVQQRYTRIDYMAVAQLASDPQLEAVILADDRLFIFDGYNRNLQWSSTTNMVASFIVIGNVDDDPQLELVLNSGIIVDSRFFNIQFQTDQVFGDRLSLADITGDGYPEVFGEFQDRSLRVFDVWRGREVW
jgi:hypothetical protein